MRVVCISDTHERHGQLRIPEADVLIHAGDFSGRGSFDSLSRFSEWMQEQKPKYKIMVAGNHDFCFEKSPALSRGIISRQAPDVIYLQDSSVTIEGVKFYGAPWTPRFFDWAFNLDRGLQISKKWQQIPDDTDVLITHGPPHGILDLTPRNDKVGCEALAERISFMKKLKLHVFGHVHHSYGTFRENGRVYVNAATCNEKYEAAHEPIVVEIKGEEEWQQD